MTEDKRPDTEGENESVMDPNKNEEYKAFAKGKTAEYGFDASDEQAQAVVDASVFSAPLIDRMTIAISYAINTHIKDVLIPAVDQQYSERDEEERKRIAHKIIGFVVTEALKRTLYNTGIYVEGNPTDILSYLMEFSADVHKSACIQHIQHKRSLETVVGIMGMFAMQPREQQEDENKTDDTSGGPAKH